MSKTQLQLQTKQYTSTNNKTNQNEQNQNVNKLLVMETAGDGGGTALQLQVDAPNQAHNFVAETNILTICMEHLQRQMQTLLLCSDPSVSTSSKSNAGTKCSTRSNSQVTQQRRNSNTPTPSTEQQITNDENSRPLSKSARLRRKRKEAQRNKYVAIDCEMVGVGHNGQEDMLARVSIVNRQGGVLLDKFVKPWHKVVDYRTSISGIRPKDIENGEDFSLVQDQVLKILKDKILVGHAIRNDLAVLHIKHPYKNVRDTARYKPLNRLACSGRTPSLKLLSQTILGIEIQKGEHSSVEDARAAMKIYNLLSNDWEKYLRNQQRPKF